LKRKPKSLEYQSKGGEKQRQRTTASPCGKALQDRRDPNPNIHRKKKIHIAQGEKEEKKKDPTAG